jgi:hypothetical protein
VALPILGSEVGAVGSASRIEAALHRVEQVAEVEDVGAALAGLAEMLPFEVAIGVDRIVVGVGAEQEPNGFIRVADDPDD